MAEINHQIFDRTLAKVDEYMARKMSGPPKRTYVGMSGIGRECLRQCWYDFRLVSNIEIQARGACAIEDGFDQETKMANRLRHVDGIELHTIDPGTRDQIACSFLDGHFSGHIDGMIKGLVESPEKWHIWEHKSVNHEKFEKLKKLRIDKGEKEALKEWDFVYWIQAQCYMAAIGVDRHFLTVSNPGGREYISVRSEAKPGALDGILEKAHQIIKGDIPEKISEKPEFYLCKWCNHSGVCHEDKAPLKNCGTCKNRQIMPEGRFKCLLEMNDKFLDDMDPCDHYDILDCFSVGQVIQSEFDGEKVDSIKIKGW